MNYIWLNFWADSVSKNYKSWERIKTETVFEEEFVNDYFWGHEKELRLKQLSSGSSFEKNRGNEKQKQLKRFSRGNCLRKISRNPEKIAGKATFKRNLSQKNWEIENELQLKQFLIVIYLRKVLWNC